MKDSKILIGIIIATFVLIGGGVVLLGGKSTATSEVVSEVLGIEANPTFYDLGDVGINGGIVTKEYAIKNTSGATIKLKKIATSCMCTTAQVVINGQSSPAFGMHAKSSWSGEVLPGQSVDLVVVFDPAFHGPSGVGAITRIVTVDTNDSKNSQLSFTLTANVVN